MFITLYKKGNHVANDTDDETTGEAKVVLLITFLSSAQFTNYMIT